MSSLISIIPGLFGATVVIFDPIELDKLLKGPDGAVAADMERLGVTAEGIAKELCPVDTGNLRSHIRHATQLDESGQVCGYVGSDVNYTIYPELGTMYQAPQPFLRPAVEQAISATGPGWLGSLVGDL